MPTISQTVEANETERRVVGGWGGGNVRGGREKVPVAHEDERFGESASQAGLEGGVVLIQQSDDLLGEVYELLLVHRRDLHQMIWQNRD